MNFKNLLIYFTVSLILVFLFEFLSRIFLWKSENTKNEQLMGRVISSFSENNFGDWYPNTDSIWLDNKNFPFNVKINSDGFRKSENLDGNLKKILVLGDSFTFGLYTSNQDVWTSLVERKLQKNNYKYEILNNGIPGSTIKDHKDFLIEKINDYKFDHVLLVIYSNDLQDLQNGLNNNNFVRSHMKSYQINDNTYFTKNNIKYLLDKYFASYSVLRKIKNSLFKNEDNQMFIYECGTETKKIHQNTKKEYLNILDNIFKLLNSRNINLSILYIPGVFEIKNYIDSDFRNNVINKIKSFNISYLDLYPYLKNKNLFEIFLLDPMYENEDLNSYLCKNESYPNDTHMSRYGHIVISEIIFNHLKLDLNNKF